MPLLSPWMPLVFLFLLKPIHHPWTSAQAVSIELQQSPPSRFPSLFQLSECLHLCVQETLLSLDPVTKASLCHSIAPSPNLYLYRPPPHCL